MKRKSPDRDPDLIFFKIPSCLEKIGNEKPYPVPSRLHFIQSRSRNPWCLAHRNFFQVWNVFFGSCVQEPPSVRIWRTLFSPFRGIENALDFFQNFRSNPKVSQFAFPLNDVKCELTTSILYPSNLVILPRYIGRRTEGSLHLIATCLPERSKVIFESKDNAEHENSVKMKIGLLNR